jgi:hypothetical protein
MNGQLNYLAANERVADMRRAAAKSHLAATQTVGPDHPRAVRRPRPAWWRLTRPLPTP